MTRILIAAWLSALLLGLQQQGFVHALQHDVGRLEQRRGATLHAPAADAPCALCALLAGGTHAVASDAKLPVVRAAVDRAPLLLERSIAAAAPAFYSSRAPPPSL